MKLKEMLLYSERLFKETGYYYGLKELKLKEEDPLKFERGFARLRGAVVAARETALHISASPIVRNIGELCFALYTPEGDSIVLSTGIIVHVHTMSEAIKWMIRNDYEDDPGINDGDIFSNNDPLIGDVHPTDVHTMIPIFYKGEIVGWAGGVTHEIDIGATTPGHDPIVSTSRFEDGLYLVCEKIGSNHKIHKDHRIRCQKAVRTPLYWDLDEKCRVAGCYIIRDAVLKFIEEEGIDYYKEFIREVIEDGRRIFIQRVKERLVPGRYRAVQFAAIPFKGKHPLKKASKNILMHAPMEIEITKDGRIRLSFDGASKPGPHPFNCSETAMQGGLWVLLSQVITYDGRVNDGSYFAMEYHFPEGSWCNTKDPTASFGTPWMFLIPAYGGLFPCLSRGFFARGYREEVIAGYGPTGSMIAGGGISTILNLYFPVANFELSCVGLGASAVKDGLDWGYAMWNPESDQGDAEIWELLELGLPYLSRRVKPNTAGYGKYRGGSGWECIRVARNVKDFEIYLVSLCHLLGGGIFGGYPLNAGYLLRAHNTNLMEIFEKKMDYPIDDEIPAERKMEKLIKGEVIRNKEGVLFPTEFRDYDLIHYILFGGPGCGDPIEREPERVKEDLDGRIYTKDIAEKVFGVVAHEKDGKFVVNLKETEERRKNIREERRKKSISFEEFKKIEFEKLKSLPEHVKEMFRESFELSPRFKKEFLEFYGLKEDFEIE